MLYQLELFTEIRDNNTTYLKVKTTKPVNDIKFDLKTRIAMMKEAIMKEAMMKEIFNNPKATKNSLKNTKNSLNSRYQIKLNNFKIFKIYNRSTSKIRHIPVTTT